MKNKKLFIGVPVRGYPEQQLRRLLRLYDHPHVVFCFYFNSCPLEDTDAIDLWVDSLEMFIETSDLKAEYIFKKDKSPSQGTLFYRIKLLEAFAASSCNVFLNLDADDYYLMDYAATMDILGLDFKLPDCPSFHKFNFVGSAEDTIVLKGEPSDGVTLSVHSYFAATRSLVLKVLDDILVLPKWPVYIGEDLYLNLMFFKHADYTRHAGPPIAAYNEASTTSMTYRQPIEQAVKSVEYVCDAVKATDHLTESMIRCVKYNTLGYVYTQHAKFLADSRPEGQGDAT